MNQKTEHPTAEQLGEYAVGRLDTAGNAGVEQHLAACQSCRAGVAEWQVLYRGIEALPHFEPAPGFALRVMAKVRVPRPWHERATEFISGWLPHTTRGWAAAAAILALPVLAGGSMVAWLLSKSYVTTQGLWTFATGQVSNAATGVLSGALDRLVQSNAVAWLAAGLDSVLATAGMRGIGLLAGLGAVLIVASVWVLYRNLIRTPHRDSDYVTYCF